MANVPRRTTSNPDGGCVAEIVSDLSALEKLQLAWDELAANAIEPNPFYESFALLPALRHLAAKTEVRILLIWAGDVGGRRLVGLLPLERGPISPWLPVWAWMPWQHRYCFLVAPLIHREFAGAVSQAILSWFSERGSVAVLSCIGGGAFDLALGREANGMGLGLAEAERRYRALFQASDSAELYMARSLSGRHRKGYRRMERQLATQGTLEYRVASHSTTDIDAWIEEFLQLEAAGWKGKAGTAFAAAPSDRQYFHALIANAHAQGRLMGLGLYLDGRPVAMKANLLCGKGGFCFKICYDEAFAKYSPGVLLELENIREAHRLGLRWLDSCADEDHPMIDRLWPERRVVRTMFVARKWAGVLSPAAPLAALRRAKRAADRLRRPARPEPRVIPGDDCQARLSSPAPAHYQTGCQS